MQRLAPSARQLREAELGKILHTLRYYYVSKDKRYPEALVILYLVALRLKLIGIVTSLKYELRNTVLPLELQSIKDGEYRHFGDLVKDTQSIVCAMVASPGWACKRELDLRLIKRKIKKTDNAEAALWMGYVDEWYWLLVDWNALEQPQIWFKYVRDL